MDTEETEILQADDTNGANAPKSEKTEKRGRRVYRDATGENENAYEQQLKRRKKSRIIKTVITIIVLAVVLTVGYQAYKVLKRMNEAKNAPVSNVTYRVQQVREGSVTTTLSASGSLTPVSEETRYSDHEATVKAVNMKLLGEFREGDVLVELALDGENELLTQLDELNEKIEQTDHLTDTKYLRAEDKGIIKDLKIGPGSDVRQVMDEYGYIALICLDSRMQVKVKTDLLKMYDTATVQIGKKKWAGVVNEYADGVANVIIETYKPLVGEQAEVLTNAGELCGTGSMELVSFAKVTATDGYVTSITAKDGTLVRRNSKIALCSALPTSRTYLDLLEEREELLEDIEEVTVFTAPFDGRVLEIDVKAGDEITPDDVLYVIESKEGYTVALSVDEMDISALELGQRAEVELDALEGTFEGEVSNISYVNASSSSIVRYTATVRVGDIEGALPSMSASCTVITSDSGNGLIVPAEAVQTVNGKSVVYKAPADAEFAHSYAESEIDLNALTAVEVTVGQSDGRNVIVSGEGLSAKDLILVKQTATTARYTSSNASNNFGNWGGMPNMGGGMPNMGGMGGGNNRNGYGSGRTGGSSNRSGNGR